MKMEQIKAFLAVAQTGSFSKAGESLYLSQPTVSRYIQELEQELKAELVVRGKKGCELTQAGRKAYAHARQIDLEWERMKDEIQIAAQGTVNTLRIGYSYNEILPMITRALSRNDFLRSHVDLSMRFGEGEALAQMIRKGELDCAVVHLPSIVSRGHLQIRTIRECGMSVQVHRGSPLYRYETIHMSDLAGQTDVRIRGEAPFYRAADEAFLQMGIPLMKHSFVTFSDECRTMLVAKGYLCLTPSIYSPEQDCKLIPVVDWPVDYPLVLLSAPTRSSNLESLLTILQKEM